MTRYSSGPATHGTNIYNAGTLNATALLYDMKFVNSKVISNTISVNLDFIGLNNYKENYIKTKNCCRKEQYIEVEDSSHDAQNCWWY